MNEMSSQTTITLPQKKPLICNSFVRTVIGLFLFLGTIYLIGNIEEQYELKFDFYIILTLVGWLPSYYFTDKYRHKYPQRYFSYLFASHSKAFLVLSFFLLLVYIFSEQSVYSLDFLVSILTYFTLADFIISIPNISQKIEIKQKNKNVDTKENDIEVSQDEINTNAILQAISSKVEEGVSKFLKTTLTENNSGNTDYSIRKSIEKVCENETNGFFLLETSVNKVQNLEKTTKNLKKLISFGGYGVIHFTPLNKVNDNLKTNLNGLVYKLIFPLHFIWKRVLPKIPILDKIYFSPLFSWLDFFLYKIFGKNRVISKPEMYGRLISQGMKIQGSFDMGDKQYVLFQRISNPVQNKKPSYYAVVALEKVGLNGEVIRLHKVRSMFPYSEFLQQYMYETEGLTETGKFKNDYRLTEYGPFIRKYWIDELPQMFDWLHGDIKLVGMRATSPQYLSLYPQKIYDLYTQVKPGLVPPIFDEKTTGFDDIVKIEMDYLEGYLKSPFKTDMGLFYKTFSDIFVRGVRSK